MFQKNRVQIFDRLSKQYVLLDTEPKGWGIIDFSKTEFPDVRYITPSGARIDVIHLTGRAYSQEV